MADIWKFYKDTDGKYRWERKTGIKVVGASKQGYEKSADCVADARRNGYHR